MRFSLPASFGREFRRTTARIFGDELVFAFVFGSFAKGFGKRGHDIDTFVCVRNVQSEPAQEYLAWMRGVHERFDCCVDEDYPAEIVAYRRLLAIEGELHSFSLSLADVNDHDCMDVAVWVQVLSDAKIFTTGSAAALRRFERAFADAPHWWKAAALRELGRRGAHLVDEPPLYFIKNVYRFAERAEGGHDVHPREDHAALAAAQG